MILRHGRGFLWKADFAGKPFCLGYRRRHLSSTVCKRSPEVTHECRTRLSEGIRFGSNKQKLTDLGFVYDMDILEAQWTKLNPYAHYYTSAIIALSCGSYGEGRTAFKKFLEGDPSLKQRLIYFIVLLSSVIRFDLVNPLATFRMTTEKIMHAHFGSFIRRE